MRTVPILALAPLIALPSSALSRPGWPGAAPTAPAQVTSPCDTAFARVAEVRGRVDPAGARQATAEVYLFDGFELRRAATTPEGWFCLPVARSTPGTFVSVFAARPGFLPQVRNLRVNQADPQRGRRDTLQAGTIALRPSPNPAAGTLVGVAYVRTESGRPRPHEGILRYDAALAITVSGADGRGNARAALRTDSLGVFTAQLPPGTYRVVSSRNVVVDGVAVQAGRTTVQPVLSGREINF